MSEAKRDAEARRDSEERFRSYIQAMEEGLVLRGADGAILSCNGSAERILGLTADQMAGLLSLDPGGCAVREDGSDFPLEEHPTMIALREGIPQRGVVMGIHKPSGGLTWISINAIPLFHSGEARPHGSVCTISDITERKRSEEERVRLAAIVESSHDAIFAVTLEGTLISWNRGAEQRYGYAPELIIGRHASVLAPPEESGFITETIQAILRGEKRENVEVRRQRADGTWMDLSLTFSPIKNAAGQIIGVASIGRDITAQKQAEAALRNSAEALRTVMEGAPIVLYATDAQGVVTLSEGAGLARLGLAPGEVVGQSVFEMYQDVPEILSYLKRALAGEIVTYEIILNGLCYHNDVRPQRDQQGIVTGIIAMAYDLTERWRAEEALRQSQESLEQAQAMAHVGSWEIDCRSGAKRWSPEMFRISGLTLAPEPPMDWSLNTVHPDDRAEISVCMEESLAHGTPYSLDYRVVWPAGALRHVQAHCEPRRDEAGKVLALRGTAMDITERKVAEQALKDFSVVLEFQKHELEKANAELASLAMLDGLTGLRNRRAFDTRLQEEFERAVRYHSPLSLVLLDIDRFKQYNDAFGHLAGDEALREVGRILQKAMRETDFLCRYGGEEIAIIMPETDCAGAMQVAERVRTAVAAAPWDKRRITASLGGCTLELEMDQPEELVAGADRALYHSKANGRNCVTHERGCDAAPAGTASASLELVP